MTLFGLRRQRHGHGGGWPARGKMRVSGTVVVRVQGLNCRAESLLWSDRRPTGVPEERKQGLLSGKKAVMLPLRVQSLRGSWAHRLNGGKHDQERA